MKVFLTALLSVIVTSLGASLIVDNKLDVLGFALIISSLTTLIIMLTQKEEPIDWIIRTLKKRK